MWQRVRALMLKEFLALLKDRKSRMVLIVPPMVQLFVFGYAATFDLNNVPYAVLNQDHGSASRELLARLEGSPNFHLLDILHSEDEVGPVIDSRRARVVVTLGPSFSRDLLSGHPAQVQVVVDGRNSNSALVVLGYIRSIVSDFSLAWAAENGGTVLPSTLTMRAWYNPNLESRWFIVPGIVGMLTLVVSLLVTALTVAREREAGTWDQLLVTPLGTREMILGKTLPGLVIGLIQGSLITFMAVFWFKVPLVGNLATLYLGMFLFLLSGVGVGLFISSLARTQQQALLGAFLFLVPAVILSGFATPIASMHPLVQKITFINPLRYFMSILRSVFLEGAGLDRLWPLMLPLACIGLVTLGLAGWMFRRRAH